MVGGESSVDHVGKAPPSYFYRVYGLEIACSVPLPELIAGGRGLDAAIRFAPVAHRPPDEGRVDVKEDAFYVRFADVGTFRIDKREVSVDLVPGARELTLRLILTSVVLGLLLHRRGELVLHASTVAVDDVAIGFLGGPGVGKSTTAAAFHAAGHRLLSDDLLPAAVDGAGVVVQSGYPQQRLWPEAIASLGGDAARLPRVHPDLEKRVAPITELFEPAALPLERLYLLSEGPVVAIKAIPGAQSVIELVRHTYVAHVLALARGAWLFEQCAAIAERVPLKRLERPSRLSGLREVVHRVEADLSGTGARSETM